jgi:transposase
MNSATKTYLKQVVIWLLWALALFACVSLWPEQPPQPAARLPALVSEVYRQRKDGWLLRGRYRLRLLIGRGWRLWLRAVWAGRVAKLAVQGALTLAQVVDWLTQAQLRRQLGALPVLYALLDRLRVREIINRHCPTNAQVDHGTVALVLMLNRLSTPQPLYKVADWLAHTVLVQTLGIPAAKFNDDRLGRTLDALAPHTEAIWLEVIQQAYRQADLDVTVLFYDLTAYVLHGEYPDSELVDFGFAHNTPMNKRKFKQGLTVTADGYLPAAYQLWSGRTADKATVQQNLAQLQRFLGVCGVDPAAVLLVGDRANLNDELAWAYREAGLRYLSGLQVQRTVHRELVAAPTVIRQSAYALSAARGSRGYWGIPCQISFEHAGRQLQQRGLIVCSGPMAHARRKSRAQALRALRQELRHIQAQIGQPYYRTVKSVQRRADTRCKNSPVGEFMGATAYTDDQGQVRLRWWIERAALIKTMAQDGRYLLVTNDWSLSPQQMLDLYRQKDGVEKRFEVAKQVLDVAPVYLHQDTRITGMMLINMLALLTYSLLEREVRQHGVQLTARRVIETLRPLEVIETQCWDGSRLYRLTPLDTEQLLLLEVLSQVVGELILPRGLQLPLPACTRPPLILPPPEPPPAGH